MLFRPIPRGKGLIMHSHALTLLLFVTSSLGQPRARGDERLAVVEGEARCAGTGMPASGATLLFFNRDDSGWSVVTDDEGRFRWQLPGRQVVWSGQDGKPGPPCGVMIQDARSWSWEIVGADACEPPNAYSRNECFRVLRKPAITRWRVTDQGPRLVVECPEAGDVEVMVLGPDGAPLADRAVRVFAAEAPFAFRGNANVEFRGRTDSAGVFRLRWFAGTRRLRALVPDVGFGTTGVFEVLAGRTARADLPPLARFARVEGTLDPKLRQAGMMVCRLPDMASPRAWARAQSAVDDQGRFVLRDVVPGSFLLAVGRGGHGAFPRMNSVRVRAEPGHTIRDLVFRPPASSQVPPATAPASAQVPPALGGALKQDIVWVEGTARDLGGRGIAGANVFVRTSYNGGSRMYEQIRETTTDSQGRYRISGPLLEGVTPLIVVVHAKGRPPVVAYAAAPSAATSGHGPVDVTLAGEDASGSIRVHVLKDGQPFPGASVVLSSDGAIELGMWASEAGKLTPAWTETQAIFYPRATTGADGTAHFTKLVPGAYEVTASAGPPAAASDAGRSRKNSGREYGIAQGVGVAAGQEVETAIALHPLTLAVPLQILRPDGTPVVDQNVAFSVGLRSPGVSTTLKLDARGIGSHLFEAPGLWAVDVRFRDSKLTSFPLDAEPFYQAEALLPVSPGCALPDPIRLTGVLRERGSLRAELRDVNDKPALGTVMFISTFAVDRNVEQAGSTDTLGVVRFAGLSHGRYTLHGSINGLAPPLVPGRGRMPEDAALRNQVAFADQTVEVETAVESHAVVRPQEVGYVRGTLRPPAGRSVAEYRFFPAYDARVLGPRQQLDAKTGEFVAGPFFAGPVKFQMIRILDSGQVRQAGAETVEVPAGTAVRMDLRPHEDPVSATAPDATARVSLGIGGLRFLNEVPRAAGATAWLADGKTPAFGARGLLLAPGLSQPVASAVSDAAGNLTWRGRWVSSQTMTRDGARATKPRAVVWLPGRSGAAVVEVEAGKPIRAILPAPLDAHGTVSLGHRTGAGVNARLRIVAAYQGQGDADAALSLATTADAQGHFILRGLTPGRYEVQAARDGIWLSPSVALAVEAGKPIPELALDIPEPGAPVVVELVDRTGRAVPQRPLTVARPRGPLAALWPAALQTDSAGRLTLWGLETGTHSIQIAGEPAPRRLQVLKAERDAHAPRIVRFVCDLTP